MAIALHSVGFLPLWDFSDRRQPSRGKFDNFQCTTAGFTTSVLDGYGLRNRRLARPARHASYAVLVHRLAPLLHASFRPRLATTPLRFTNLHLHQVGYGTSTRLVVEHARHTYKTFSSYGADFE